MASSLNIIAGAGPAVVIMSLGRRFGAERTVSECGCTPHPEPRSFPFTGRLSREAFHREAFGDTFLRWTVLMGPHATAGTGFSKGL